MFGIGNNDLGQLGITSHIKIVSTPLHMANEIFQIGVVTYFIEQGIVIHNIECGTNCSLFLTKENAQHKEKLYGAGLSLFGELGGVHQAPISDGPSLLNLEWIKASSQLSSGQTFSAILTGKF